MSNDMSGVSRASWIAIPQAMQQHGQARRATPSKETAVGERVGAVSPTSVERTEAKLP